MLLLKELVLMFLFAKLQYCFPGIYCQCSMLNAEDSVLNKKNMCYFKSIENINLKEDRLYGTISDTKSSTLNPTKLAEQGAFTPQKYW